MDTTPNARRSLSTTGLGSSTPACSWRRWSASCRPKTSGRGGRWTIQRELCQDGFVLRYPSEGPGQVDGLPGGEGAFLACTFWLADNLCLLGRHEEGRSLFEQLLSVANDVGLLAEEYDPVSRRLVGNFPQAFSHVAVVNTARNLSRPARLTGHPVRE